MPRLIRDFKVAPEGHTTITYLAGTEVTGRVARLAEAAGAIAPPKPPRPRQPTNTKPTAPTNTKVVNPDESAT